MLSNNAVCMLAVFDHTHKSHLQLHCQNADAHFTISHRLESQLDLVAGCIVNTVMCVF